MRTAQVAGLMVLCAVMLGAQGASRDDAAAIRAARLAQNAAMAAGDVDRAATFWTADVTIRRGLGAGLSGIDAYKAILERAPIPDSALVYQRAATDVHVSPQWPLAFETGTWNARVGGRGPEVMSGRYSAQWVKRDGRWLIRSEVFVALTCSGTGCGATAVP
jgi:ketosteroid isomerase-like protein